MKKSPNQISPLAALLDLVLFIGLMFFVRTIYFESLGFWGNAVFKTTATVGLATLLLYFRKQSWKDLGLTKPESYKPLIIIVAVTLVTTVITMILFQIFVADMFSAAEQTAAGSAVSTAERSIASILSIILFIWIESFLEELQDRGFSLNRFESLFSKVPFSTILAVLFQAGIFGFRHSYDLSERSLTTGLIGLVFGIAYVVTGRNLWPLIIAHVILNTLSMIDNF
ncbi:CPBP family intramembrane glutamic endopeptidase [Ekhidna sp. To15]|uniref:CPBP family intramembrane glutamic endopeptidase n=1 Tax=Ekhidna sp. To15 TaxID=3395267 RepID=UPI003F51B6EB